MGAKAPSRVDLLQGTLDLLILKTLSREPVHGWGISKRIQALSGDVLSVGQGSLYPALQRLLKTKLVKAEWSISPSTNRRVRVYQITKAGLRHLEREISSFDRMLDGIHGKPHAAMTRTECREQHSVIRKNHSCQSGRQPSGD